MLMLGLPAALCVLTLAAAAGRAPSPEEQKAFAEGLRLYEAGDARGAERVWKAGYAAGGDAAFLVRIGEAEEKAGAPKEALQSYERYLRESPDAADRADIEGRVRRLAPPSSRKPVIDVEIPGEMGGSGAEARPIPAAPGAAEQPGSVPPAAVQGGAQKGQAIPATQARDDGNEDLHPVIEDEAPRSILNTAAWAGTGVTALLLGVAAFYGASAAEKAGDANRLITYADQNTLVPREYALHAREYEENVRLGQRYDRIATGFVIAAGVTALTSAVLFISDSGTAKNGSDVQTRASAGAHPGSGSRRPALTLRRGQSSALLDLGLDLAWSF